MSRRSETKYFMACDVCGHHEVEVAHQTHVPSGWHQLVDWPSEKANGGTDHYIYCCPTCWITAAVRTLTQKRLEEIDNEQVEEPSQGGQTEEEGPAQGEQEEGQG